MPIITPLISYSDEFTAEDLDNFQRRPASCPLLQDLNIGRTSSKETFKRKKKKMSVMRNEGNANLNANLAVSACTCLCLDKLSRAG